MIWRGIASTFLTLLVVILIGMAIMVAWGRAQYTSPGPSAAAQCVTVAQGASLNAVSQQLLEQGVVSSAYILRTGADYEGKANQLKFGSYLVPPNASMQQVVRTLTEGGPSTCGAEVVFRVGVRGNSVVLRDLDPASGRYEDRASYDALLGLLEDQAGVRLVVLALSRFVLLPVEQPPLAGGRGEAAAATCAADLILLATGYANQRETARLAMGDAVAERIGHIAHHIDFSKDLGEHLHACHRMFGSAASAGPVEASKEYAGFSERLFAVYTMAAERDTHHAILGGSPRTAPAPAAPPPQSEDLFDDVLF